MEDEYLGYKGTNFYCKDVKEGWVDPFEYIIKVSDPIKSLYSNWIDTKNNLTLNVLTHRVVIPKFLLESNVNLSWILQYRELPKKNICEICGAMHYTNNPFCSATCSIKYCEQNGIWYQRVKLKGYSPLYCKKFNNDLKTRVRTFFNYTCFLCGKTEEENGRKLSVHHVNYDKHVCCNDKPVRFVPLCASCHTKTNVNRKYWEDLFENELKERYNYKCYYTKEEYRELQSQECSS